MNHIVYVKDSLNFAKTTHKIDSWTCVGENMFNKINYTIYMYKHLNVTKYLVVS